MNRFLGGEKTLAAVRTMFEAERNEIAVAVAFWGNSAIAKLHAREWKARKISIICNATSGCCSPDVLEELHRKFGDNLRTNPNLHAKVYWTPRSMVVTSANASSSGLWTTGAIEGNIEAGILVESKSLINSAKEWFDGLLADARTVVVDKKVINRAWFLWLRRISGLQPQHREKSEASRKSRIKVLNVMDKYIDIRRPRNGLYSGVWTAPDKYCRIIRVFGGNTE